MTQTTDAALVGRLRGLLAAAIPTPWQSLVADDARLLDAINQNSAVVTDRVAGLIFSRAMPGSEGHGVTIATINARRATLDTDTASADLITDAVNALPGLLDIIEAQARRIEALEGALRPMSEAPRDRFILAMYRSVDGHRSHMDGRVFTVRHEGKTVSDFDLGWALYPGYGGVPDVSFYGWMDMPAALTKAPTP